MLPLADRAAAVMKRLGRSVAPLPELTRALRENGVAVSEPVLLASLKAAPERFRVIEPWRALKGSAWVGEPWSATTWVVPAHRELRAEPHAARRPALERLQETLVTLGWELDHGSVTDVARWFGMVVEAERLRERLPAEGSPAPLTPSETAPSAAAGASATPRLRPRPQDGATNAPRRPPGRPTLLRERH